MTTGMLIALLAFALALVHASRLQAWRSALGKLRGTEHAGAADEAPPVSVVVPARNAADTLVPLLQDLYAQSVRERMEVIVVDDHSEDGTAAIVERMALRWTGLRLCRLTEAKGKKAALAAGIAAARHPLIVFTDADARCGPERVGTIARHWQRMKWDLLIAPVRTEGEGLLGMVQEEEQAALFGAAVGTWSEGRPTLAYGANLAVARAAFDAVGGYSGDRWASGDDVFLLHRMVRAGRPVAMLGDPAVTVTVGAETSWRDFFFQRVRWAGKMRSAKALRSSAGAAFGLLLPWVLLLVSCWLVARVRLGQGMLFTAGVMIAAWSAWLASTLGLAGDARELLHGRRAPARSLLALLAFTVYAPVIALAAMVVRPRWKGRRIR